MSMRAHAQGYGPGVWGARAAGLGRASVTLANDAWAAGNNPAGLGELGTKTVGFQAANQFLLANLNTVGLAVALPVGAARPAPAVPGVPAAVAAAQAPRYGVVGVTARRFGNQQYAEQGLGLSYGYRLGTVSVGARLEVLQLSIEGLGSRRAVAASLGGQADIVPRKLTFGASLSNLNQARLAPDQDERLPTVLRAGLAYRPSKKVLLLTEVEKDVEQDADVRAGLEYQVLAPLALRAGLSALTEQLTGGVGFRAGQLRIDYAAAWHTALGLSQHLSVEVSVGKLGQKP
ncbi:PorV/PorQ family protein [Hymenobacter weizhouensis]|uniref:hypothetical protein n=1 Tax=Hymenobacter sp. YIM 151500-1 TaxID=2987689 RepID=UPI0022272E1B|nr:hypothetical protein [Hymenobacter sp. YIM 151500-1]UYZ61412.1 hypothetical protein OIS53_10370 [Hymenobacter sp. YIM 151500-1]